MGMASPAPSTGSTQGETRFVPQSDDEETLWKVIEITAERPKFYKVRWDGLNPETGKPWPQSWVPKSDCTDDLRKWWKKKREEEAKKTGKGKSFLSTSSRLSTPSTSLGRKRSTAAKVTGPRRKESSSTSRSHAVKTPKSSKRKRKSAESVDHVSRNQDEDSVRASQTGSELEPVAGPSRPRKRRKLRGEDDKQPLQEEPQESYEVIQKKKYGKVVPNEDDFKEEARAAKVIPMKSKGKGKGRSKERPESEIGDEVPIVPSVNMGPPPGIKKNSKMTRSISQSHSKFETLPPLKLTTKPKKSKPSPNRFRSSPFAAKLPTKAVKQLAQTNDDAYMDLGYPDLPEQQQHDSLFMPGSDDGYNDAVHRSPAAPQTQNAPSEDGLIDFDEIPQPPSRPQPQTRSPSFEGRSAFTEQTPEPEPAQHRGFNFSPEVPETQEMESSNAQPGVEDPKSDNLLRGPQEVSPAKATPSKLGGSRKSSPSIVSSMSISESKPIGSTDPVVVTSTSIPIATVESPQKSKPLHPIPQISPSTFHPHLPVQAPTNDEVMEVPSPPSSIDYFSSPEKGQTQKSRRLESINNWGSHEGVSGNSRTETILNSDDALRARGQELTDNESREREKTTGILSDFIGGSSGGSEFEPSRMDEALLVQEMEDAYVDLSGYGGQEREESPPLAQEESTQDLEPELLVGEQMADADQEMIVEVEPSVEHAITGPFAAPEPKPRSRSNSMVASISHADVTVEELPPTLSPPRPPTPDTQALTRSQSEPLQSPSHGLRHAMGLLNVKSEEISRLQTALDFERGNNKTLTSTIKKLEDTLAPLSNQPSLDAIALAVLQMQRADEHALWDAERAELVAARDESIRAKTSAETDRDFFRDQYAQASGYVSSIRSENVELEQRALVAEGKAKDGVGMIKAMFEGQIETLKGDLAKWKGIAELLQEKDRRTGDEIRRKAAEEPELRAKYAESLREIKQLEGVVFDLSAERNILKLQLDNFRAQAEGTINGKRASPLLRSNSVDTAAQGDELVYRCLWRLRRDSDPCLTIFRSPEDLEIHMYTDKHLVDLRSEQLLLPFQGHVNGHTV